MEESWRGSKKSKQTLLYKWFKNDVLILYIADNLVLNIQEKLIFYNQETKPAQVKGTPTKEKERLQEKTSIYDVQRKIHIQLPLFFF